MSDIQTEGDEMLRKLSWVLLPLLLLAACQSTTFSATCNNRTDRDVSRCEFDFDQLSGVWSRDINVAYIAESADTLPINIAASVSQGRVQVAYIDSQGDRVSHELRPDAPLEITDTIRVHDNQAEVVFSALDLSAAGVQAVVEVGPPGD
jgi:hypothetical protein